jgi:hypothetical protein
MISDFHSIFLHTGCEYHQIIPLTYYRQEEVNMRSFINIEFHWIIFNENFHVKIRDIIIEGNERITAE